MKKSTSKKLAARNEFAQNSESSDFLIVGIGASAGGIQALKSFFQNVAADSNAAYVVILHLSPDHDSKLAEVLQTVSRIPVTQVKKKVKVEPNHVYVVPPNESLSMADGHIVVSPIQTVEERRAPVDIFFRTLAESHCSRAVAVVLSGTGANGSMGIKRVKERGGAAFVQNPREAEFSEMPRNSIATDLIDEILNVAEIPKKIAAYGENLGKVVIPIEPENREEAEQSALREIFTQLRVRTGHDFSNYKRPTVLRRIERRINVRNLPDLPAYTAYLKETPEETTALLKDLLISVTNFFRDKAAFDFLEREVVPRILLDKKSGDEIRLWVAGCATGEEAYSLAMMLAEKLNGSHDAPSIQIFATDIDDAAIAAARNGFYTLNDAADVSPERLRRFFTQETGGYRVRRELRELILFAQHNLLKDPPFSRLDLATCRNLLIYFNHQAQERAMETFHFSLKTGGYLFLGSSESVDGAGDLFAPINREQRIFQSRQTAPRFSHPVPDLSKSFSFDVSPKNAAARETETRPVTERISYGDLHGEILEQFAPPSIVVNEQFDIVHVSENAGRYLRISGELSNNLFDLIRPELRLELSTAVYQAVERQKNVVAANLRLNIDDRSESVNVQVRPVLRFKTDAVRGFLVILFQKTGDAPGGDNDDNAEAVYSSPEPAMRQLEEALLSSRSEHRNAIEHSEIQAEELKASNEELQAINEELRSATEELETGKEELQSVNEELVTVNQELKIKIEELSVSNSDLQNLMNSTNIGTIFLDRTLRVKMFTPAALEIFNLIPADIGRGLSDITHRLEDENLIGDVETVLNKLQPVEREVRTADAAVYLMQVAPYRTAEDRINGTIVTFVNITKRKQSEEALRESEEKYRTLFDSIDDGYCVIEMIFDQDGKPLDYTFIETNPAFVKQSGLIGAVGKRMREIHPQHEDSWFEIYGRVAQTGESIRLESYGEQLGKRWFDLYAARVGGAESKRVAVIFQDITERKQTEENLRRAAEFNAYRVELNDALRPLTDPSEIQLQAIRILAERLAVDNAHYTGIDEAAGIFRVEREFRRTAVAPEMIGEYSMSDFKWINPTFLDGGAIVISDAQTSTLIPDQEQRAVVEGISVGALITVPLIKNERLVAALSVVTTAAREWTAEAVELVRETAERTWAAVEHARAEEALRESEERFRAMFEQANVGIVQLDFDGRFLASNPGFSQIIGYTEAELQTMAVRDLTPPDDFKIEKEENRRVLAGEISGYSFEKRCVHKSGAIVWAKMTATLVRGEAGEPLYMLSVVEDITTRKQVESALGESEDRFRKLVESVTDYAIFAIDENNRIVSWNTGAEKVFGYREPEIIGKSGAILFTPEDREAGVPEQEMQTALENGSAEDERWHIRRDGSRFYAAGVMTTFKSGAGFVKIARDMTDKIKIQKALHDKEMLQKLVSAQEDERKRIARDLHDELGQLLTGLRLKLEAVRKLCEDNAELCGRIDETQVIARRVDDGIDFLAWELRPAALDDLGLRPALEKYVREWSRFSGVTAELLCSGIKNVRLALETETNLYRIAQEAMNNIHKHAKAKSVEVSLDRRGALIVLIVADDGQGFDRENKMNRDKGIGLIGMQERAALLKGTLEIETAPGKGTTVYVRVPASPAEKENSDDQ